MSKIFDEYTDRDDLSYIQKWRIRHPDVPRVKQSPEATKLYRENNKEAVNARCRKYNKLPNVKANRRLKHSLNPIDFMYHQAAQRARDYELDFNIDKSDIVIPDFCPILDIPLFTCKGKVEFTSPSLDRVDNSKGYTKDNIRVISHRANTLKNNMTEEILAKMLQYVRGEI